jgi:sensor domain CHASE-containing protein
MQADIGLIIAIVGVGITMVAVVITMMFWVRSEANSLRAEQKEDRKDLLQLSRNLENTVSAIQSEMKEFHQRLLEIERDRNKKFS